MRRMASSHNVHRDPSPIAKLDVTRIVDHYDRIIRGLEGPPIIMGHSFGGAFMQILLDRGLGAAGVGVASATVKGVRDLPLSTIKATSPAPRHPAGLADTPRQVVQRDPSRASLGEDADPSSSAEPNRVGEQPDQQEEPAHDPDHAAADGEHVRTEGPPAQHAAEHDQPGHAGYGDKLVPRGAGDGQQRHHDRTEQDARDHRGQG
jgi:hypothetical protein